MASAWASGTSSAVTIHGPIGQKVSIALRAGYDHVAFAVADLDAAYDHAVARGASPVMPPCPAPEPGVRMAFVADPEGNLIELLHRPGRPQ
jgi:glyoxylase I family protein